ncbi:MAG TPA: DUF4179 domain-containing protein [Candidatus Mediterraneibacter norfolkensis]|nr:DUF4179 domain-containing protein [Candidatus Mediterraneibacter norfolkensis]
MQIDLNEINVPQQELQDVINRSMVSVRRMHRRKLFFRVVSRCGAAAAAIVAVVGICAANPAFAENIPLIGHIFEQVQDEQQYPGDYSTKADQLTGTNVSTSQGITVTLSEIVCTEKSMNVSAMIESEDAFPEDALTMAENMDEGYGSHFYLDADQSETSFAACEDGVEDILDLKGEFTDDHTFIGMFRIDFDLYPFAGVTIPDQFTWNLKICGISYYPGMDVPAKNLADEGEWTFSNEVTKQASDARTVQVGQYMPNGDGITDITISPYEVIINYDYDESRIQPGYERYDSIFSVMLDGSGKVINDKVGLFSPEGYDLSKITVYSLATPDEAASTEVQEKLTDESFASQLPGWLEENAVSKIEIPLEG